MKFYTKEMTLVDSARVICPNSNAITMEHEFDSESVLKIEFNFKYDNANKRVDVESPKDGYVMLNVYNFNSALGTGVGQPVEIARYNKKKIYLTFYYYKLKESSSILDVSLYLEV